MPPTLKFLCIYMQIWGDHLTTMHPGTFYCSHVDRHRTSPLKIASRDSVFWGKIVSLIFTITTDILLYQTKRFVNVAFCFSHTLTPQIVLMPFSLLIHFFFLQTLLLLRSTSLLVFSVAPTKHIGKKNHLEGFWISFLICHSSMSGLQRLLQEVWGLHLD